MSGNWKQIPPLAIRLTVMAALMWGVAIGLMNYMQNGNAQALLITLVLTVGVSAILPLALFIYRVWSYFIYTIFWYLVVTGAVVSMVFGALLIVAAPGGHGPALAGAVIVGAIWLFISRPRGETPVQRAVRLSLEEMYEERQQRRQRPVDDEPPAAPSPPPRRPAPPGPPDPDRINKELAARERRLNP